MFYVSIIRNGRVGLLSGPYEHHEDALARVDACRELAVSLDPWAHFDAFGTVRLRTAPFPFGRLDPSISSKNT